MGVHVLIGIEALKRLRQELYEKGMSCTFFPFFAKVGVGIQKINDVAPKLTAMAPKIRNTALVLLPKLVKPVCVARRAQIERYQHGFLPQILAPVREDVGLLLVAVAGVLRILVRIRTIIGIVPNVVEHHVPYWYRLCVLLQELG